MNVRMKVLLASGITLTILSSTAYAAIAQANTEPQARGAENASTKIKPAGYSVRFVGIAEETPPDQIDWRQRSLKGGTGNVTVYVEDDMPTEVYVVGVAAIPTTMNAVRAEQFAHRQAEMQAKAAFALWMKESFSVSIGTTNKTLVITSGDSDKPGTPHERSEDRMMTQENATQFANATWRGMRNWKTIQEAEKSKRIEVWRWSVKEHELARIVETLTRDGSPDSASRKQYMKVESFEL